MIRVFYDTENRADKTVRFFIWSGGIGNAFGDGWAFACGYNIYACTRTLVRKKEMGQMKTKNTVTKKQRKAAEMLVNPDFDGTVSELCLTIGVARSTFYRWQKEPGFAGYVNELIESYTNSELPRVWKSIVSKATGGDVKAQKLFMELLGKYKQKVDISGGVVFITGEDDLLE